jgi:hypothetical protein
MDSRICFSWMPDQVRHDGELWIVKLEHLNFPKNFIIRPSIFHNLCNHIQFPQPDGNRIFPLTLILMLFWVNASLQKGGKRGGLIENPDCQKKAILLVPELSDFSWKKL